MFNYNEIYVMNTTICERLIGMVKCSSSKDSDFFDLFLSNFSKISINSNNCIANSADGAANMQSAYNGFSTKLSEITKTHLWCYAHVLNIVICDLTNTVLDGVNLFGILNGYSGF